MGLLEALCLGVAIAGAIAFGGIVGQELQDWRLQRKLLREARKLEGTRARVTHLTCHWCQEELVVVERDGQSELVCVGCSKVLGPADIRRLP